MLEELNLSWHVAYEKKVKGYYAMASQYWGYVNGKPKYSTLYLARIICKCTIDDGVYVDHENHNTLDNRKTNLRISANDENLKNRNGKNKNNTSGYRNVSQIRDKWCVQMQIEGKNTCLKKFALDKLEEAGIYAAEMRQLYYGEFKGLA